MRARIVPQTIAYIFDFDETLVKSKAKIHIYKNNKKIKSLTPDEFNKFELSDGEIIDTSDFDDPRITLKADKYKMWPLLKKIDMDKKSIRTDAEIYILTGRNKEAQMAIYTFIKRNNVNIPMNNIITVGIKDKVTDVSIEKEKELIELSQQYDTIYFYDDNKKTINLASKISGVLTKLIE